jgi:methyl-accepting chemotaxis protein
MAVNQMDQVTQQNAAMVEETNAASATLAAESNRMKDLIAKFQLSNRANEVQARVIPTAAMSSPQRKTARISAPATHGNAALKQEWAEF